MDLSVIIVNYNVKYFLEQCLHATVRACLNVSAEIIVIDNNSTDGSRDYLLPKFRGVRFSWQAENLGFGRANNLAVEMAKGDYILFLNPDCLVPEDGFEKCLEQLRNNPFYSALGVRMVDGSGFFLPESKRSLPTLSAAFYKMSGLARIFPKSRIFSGYASGHLPEDEPNEVEVLAGAFLMATREAITRARGFDTDFFMYGEDIDLSYRLTSGGFSLLYFPVISIIHFKGESAGQKSMAYIRHFYGAMNLFTEKHASRASRIISKPAIWIAKNLAGIRHFVTPFSTPTNTNAAGFILVGSEEDKAALTFLLLNKMPAASIISSPDYSFSKVDINPFITQLKHLCSMHTGYALIFCCGDMKYQTAIAIMRALQGSTAFYFHGSQTASIVGSSHRSRTGTSIAL